MKSQVLTLENVIFFSLGIALVLIVYFTFTSISHEIKKISIEEGVKKTAEFISYNINKVYRIGNLTNSSIELFIPIQDKICGEIYRISQDNGAIFIHLLKYDIKYNLTLYGIKTKLKYKQIPSSKKALIIKYSNGMVEIR